MSQETTIAYDYETGLARCYTTKQSVYDGFVKRLGDAVALQRATSHGYQFTVPLADCRQPYLIAKVRKRDDAPKLRLPTPTRPATRDRSGKGSESPITETYQE